MPSVIFYSWQSDLPAEHNQHLILSALQDAASQIRADGSLSVEPVVDRDTAGVPGTPDIAAVILDKIENCDVVVCDVTPIGIVGPQSRPTPNPNVMLELGYALRARGWGRVLLVFNQAYGKVTDLPFDLRTKRVIPYRADSDANAPDAGRAHLGHELEDALRLLYQAGTSADSTAFPSSEDRSWMDKQAELAFHEYPRHFGLSLEVFAVTSPKPRVHAPIELVEIADRAQIHTFGWPIGIMSRQNPDFTPRPMNDGIALKLQPDRGSFDFWALRTDGAFYLLKSLFEQEHGQEGVLFFDTRVVRATEVCMYLERLYTSMGLSGTARVSLQLRYAGLAGARLKATQNRIAFHERGPAAEATISPQVATTLAALRDDTVTVVKAITEPLFMLFDYFQLSDDAYRQIVDQYKAGRVA
jgi:hypothetical protein